MDQLQQLQQLTTLRAGAMDGVLKTVLIMWLIWPVICGLIGAGRGKAMAGFMQGLFWGPFGLLPVLLSAKKYPCPTCGCQTLKHPMADRPYEPTVARTVARVGTDMPPIPLEPSAPAVAAPPLTRFVIPTPAELEAQQLHKWVNDEPVAAGSN